MHKCTNFIHFKGQQYIKCDLHSRNWLTKHITCGKQWRWLKNQNVTKNKFRKKFWAMTLRIFFFYIHGSMHRNSTLIRSNSMQVFIYCKITLTCFGCPSHPSSGEHKTVTAASGTEGRLLHRYVIWPVPEVAVTVWCTLDEGCDRHPKHVE